MSSTRLARALCACVALLGLAAPACAVDSVSFEAGPGDAADLARVGLQWNAPSQHVSPSGRVLSGYLDFTGAVWKDGRALADLALTPILRLEHGPARPYFEIGLGVHLLSSRPARDEREFSTALQLALDLGTGFRFGEGGRYDLALRVQHVSNGGLRKPNPGANFILLRLRCLLQP